jgi:hypothetical protein
MSQARAHLIASMLTVKETLWTFSIASSRASLTLTVTQEQGISIAGPTECPVERNPVGSSHADASATASGPSGR